MAYYVYIHTNKINGKRYVGITTQKPEVRWKNGKGYLGCRKNQYNNPKFAKAILKYGWDNFNHQVWEVASKEDMLYGEKYLIGYYDTIRNGYNCTTGGEHYSFTEESRKRKSDKMKGIVFSDEHKRNISAAKKGKPGKAWNEDRKKQYSEMFKGRVVSEEWKQRISDNSTNKRKVAQYSLDGNLIKVFDSVIDAINSVDGAYSARGWFAIQIKKNKPYKGYVWKYYDL